MPINVLMPALSPTMTEGALVKWHKSEGDRISAGDMIAEIETDKATVEIEAVDEGTLGKIVVPEGTKGVQVNAVIAIILEEGEDASALEAAAAAEPAPAPAAVAEPVPESAAKPPSEAPAAGIPTPAPASTPPPPIPGPPSPDRGGRLFASPLARRVARQAGLDLARVTGTGPHGRIVKRDIDGALAKPLALALPALVAEAPGAPAYREVPLSPMRKAIARRLVEAKREAPHIYLTIDCEIDELLKVRAELNQRAGQDGDASYKISVNDFVIRAAALALVKVPAANASWSEEAIRQYESADISVAVAIPGGLITPIIRNAERKGLAAISNEMRELAPRAREGKLRPEEYQGGTFTVSNLGMYGIREFAAILNPPQGCILAVGTGEQRPVVKDGALAAATVMTCTLSADHRVVDGAVGAEFLAAFKRLIEDPLTMLL